MRALAFPTLLGGCGTPENGAGVATSFIALTGAQLGESAAPDTVHILVADHEQACADPIESAWDYADECARKWQLRVRVPPEHLLPGAQLDTEADVDLTSHPGSSTPPCVNLVFATISGTVDVVALDNDSVTVDVAFADDLCWTEPPTSDSCRNLTGSYTATRCP